MRTLIFISIAIAMLLCHPFKTSTDLHNCSASNSVLKVKQPDGRTIQIIGQGNSLLNYTETSDGYTVVEKNGFYEYAEKGRGGMLLSSGVRANDLNKRTIEEKKFLKNINLHQRHSKQIRKNIISRAIEQNVKEQLSNSKFPANGNNKVLVLLIQYPNLPNTYSNTDFDNLMNQPNYNGTGSFRDYFMKNSFGKLNLSIDVSGWYTSEHNYDHYSNFQGSTAAMELVAEALDAAEANGVNFADYDNDNDGETDGIIVIHAGPGAEVGAQNQYIWSQKSTLHQQYSRNYDGVAIKEFIVNPETRPWGMVGIGVICHEFGHLLGFPDLYDLDNSSAGIGNWGLMGKGSWLNNEKTPANLCAWAKEKQEWIEPIVITEGYHAVMPADFTATCYRINTPNPDEYFLLENKQNIGNDQYLPGEGLAIWHIDSEKANLYPTSNFVNLDEQHKGVDLEEADGFGHMDNAQGLGDAGDLFPGTGNVSVFGEASSPNSDTYIAGASGIAITNIFKSSAFVSFILNGNGTIPCDINNVNALGSVDCNEGLFDLEVVIDYVYPSNDKQLYVNGNAFDLTGSPQKVILEKLTANGEMVPLSVSIGENSDCGYNNLEFFEAPHAYEISLYETTCNPLEEGISENHYNSLSGCDSIVNVTTEYIGAQASFDFNVEDLGVSFVNNTSETEDFIWLFGDGNISYAINPTHEYSNAGNYRVTLQALKDNCMAESIDTVKVEIVTGFENETSFQNTSKIFPNPTHNFVNIELGREVNETTDIRLFDLNGAIVLRQSFLQSKSKIQLDLNNIDKGSYFLEIINGDRKSTKKLIKL